MKTISNNLNASLSLLVSSGLLLGAFFLEFYLSLLPCDLCIKQRIIHISILILSLLVFPLSIFSNLKFIMLSILNLLWLGSSILAFYHFGIEKKFWKGFSECSSNLIFNENTLDQLLAKSPIRCDETQFEIVNISLAGWNGIFSLSIFIILSYLLYKTYKVSK
ncbi:disulfide bond formation protein B [Alphaproteobacteria bacterium]|nr:disulfide bond formation protein B [Alphaproteobacteria bacterium]